MTVRFLLLGLALLLLPSAAPRRAALATGSVPLTLDLVAASLRAGQPVPHALDAAADAAPEPQRAELRAVAALLRLGADPPEAWAAVGTSSTLCELRLIAARSSVSGARLAEAFADHAARLRTAAAAVDEARAQRAAVLCAGPLAVCFLPAFACIGVIPTLIGLAAETLHAAS